MHRVLFNIPLEPATLPEGVDVATHYRDSVIKPVESVNDLGAIGYGAPCPPAGAPHRYTFRLYALSTELGLSEGVTRQQRTDAMQGHTLAQTDLLGRYGRGG